MSYQLKERPHKFVFSNNPVRYMVEVSNPSTPGCAVEVELYGLPINAGAPTEVSPGTLITRQALYPNPDGKVWFYCEDFLNSFVEWELPAIYVDRDPGAVIAVTSQIKKFYIRYRQITRTNTEPPWATDAANVRIVLKGGVAKEKFDRNNFFINHLPDEKPFMTWQPQGHFIGPDEYRYLTYFHDDVAAPVLRLKCRLVDVEGNEEIVYKPFPALANSLLFHCPASVRQVTMTAAMAGQLWYYDISVVDEEDNVYAEPFRLYVDYRKYYNDFSFIYHNSLGGIDTLRVRGEYDLDIQRNISDIQQAVNYGDDATTLPTENAMINISKYELYKGDAGWFNTRAMQDSIQDMLLSDSVYRILFNRWLRVAHLQKSQAMGGNDDTKWSFPLQWRYTFDNINYTPFDKDLGFGLNDEPAGGIFGICTAPADLVAELLGDEGGGKKFLFTWSDVAGALEYELQYKEDGAADWTTVISADNEEEIIFLISGHYSWRIRSKCGDDDYSGYAYGPGFTVDIVAPACNAPLTLTVTLLGIGPITANIRFNWPAVAGVVGYVLEYRQVGTLAWTSIATAALSVTVDLQRDTHYEARVRSNCNGADYSGFTYADSFIPSNMVGSCTPPTNLTVQTLGQILTMVPVGFGWTNAGGTASYEIQYRIVGDPSWTIQNGVMSPLVVMLPQDMDYEWRVRSNCADGGISNFVNGPNFST